MPDIALIEAELLTMQMEQDFENARQFQLGCPLSKNLAKLSSVLPVKGVFKASHLRVRHVTDNMDCLLRRYGEVT